MPLKKPGNKKNRHKPIKNLQKGRRKDLLPLAAAFFSSFLFFRSIPIQSCKQFCRHIGRYFDPLFCIFF